MLKLRKTLLVSFVFLCLVGMTIFQIRAQEDQIEAEILPSEGNANTIIILRFRTVNENIGPVDKADIFWDDSTIALNQNGTLGADNSYNYNLTVPTQPPLSDVGNHTIRVNSLVNYSQVTFTFNFTVTEFVPSPEYLALNATYSSLWTNYTSLQGNYNQLLTNYATLSAQYSVFFTNYSQLLQNYNSISANYNSLTANLNSLSSNYNSLSANFNSLEELFSSLLGNYSSLAHALDSLNSSYDILKTNYDDAIRQLAFSRNLTYILIASTIILAATTFYFARRKQKKADLKTRY